ncbi:MAG: hypothetical protein JXA54_02440 [Candidatus Heimdallarchaeota archaeon]|nr:hypothetical protein [Candidatus Heimdallarchaeota archaeon]
MFVKRSEVIIKQFEEKDIIRVFAGANFFGQESSGVWQIRGNGVLLLTPDELYFEMWMPKRKTSIPIPSIIKVEATKWHIGKTKNRLLLKVIFTNESGQTDSAAWLVRDLDQWINAIQKLINKE